MGDGRQFYTAISEADFRRYESEGSIPPSALKQWTELELGAGLNGLSLDRLREWVDDGKSDLVIVINGDFEHFPAATYSDLGYGRHDDRPLVPTQFRNIRMIPFQDVQVSYDPRELVSQEPVLTLKTILSPATPLPRPQDQQDGQTRHQRPA